MIYHLPLCEYIWSPKCKEIYGLQPAVQNGKKQKFIPHCGISPLHEGAGGPAWGQHQSRGLGLCAVAHQDAHRLRRACPHAAV